MFALIGKLASPRWSALLKRAKTLRYQGSA